MNQQLIALRARAQHEIAPLLLRALARQETAPLVLPLIFQHKTAPLLERVFDRHETAPLLLCVLAWHELTPGSTVILLAVAKSLEIHHPVVARVRKGPLLSCIASGSGDGASVQGKSPTPRITMEVPLTSEGK